MHNRLKKLRRELGLTQREFADRIGMKQNTIATYEIERAIPSGQTIRSICREFGVNEEWLRTGNGEMFATPSREDEIARLTRMLLDEESDSFKNRLISVLSNLSENQWELLADIAESLAQKKD